MKAKAMKLRILITLHALFKYTDKDYQMNTAKLNEFLRPVGLEFRGGTALSDTVRVLRDFGLDVRNLGVWDNQGGWIEDGPLPEAALKQLVFAVSTNPYLSNKQSEEILGYLRPFVTVYQEPMLQSDVRTGDIERVDQSVFDAYCVAQEAIRLGRRMKSPSFFLCSHSC